MVILGLGGNKGDREALLKKAAGALAEIVKNPRTSSLYETQALLPDGAPDSWDMPFLNMAVVGETLLSPQELLVAIKDIEKKLGRKPAQRWAPREIDIDILAMDDLILEQPELCVPHRLLIERDFALVPLAEIAPEWRYPVAGAYDGWKAADIVIHKGYNLRSFHTQGIKKYG